MSNAYLTYDLLTVVIVLLYLLLQKGRATPEEVAGLRYGYQLR